MANAFLLGWDLGDTGVDDFRRALGPTAMIRVEGKAVFAVVDDGRGAVSTTTRDDATGMLYGSGVPVDHDVVVWDHDRLLDGCDDDLVAALVTPEVVSFATGRGNHQLVHGARVGGGHVVGTSVRDVAVALGSGLRLDRSYEDFALGFGFHPEGRTPYSGVRALPGGTRFRAGPHGPVEVASVVPKAATDAAAPSSADAAAEHLFDRFLGAVERQAGRERSHAVLLGGFDSALVATCLRRLGHEVETFTFGFGDPRYEQRGAAALAASIGAVHHTVAIEPESVMARLVGFDRYFPDIGAQPHYQIHTLLGCEAIAAHGHRHVFTGDGCDSIFLGYPTVSARAGLASRMSAIPRPVAGAAESVLATALAERHLGHVARTGRSFLHNATLEMPVSGHLPTRYIDRHTLARLRPDRPPQTEPVEAIRQRLASGVAGLDPVRLAFHGNGLNRQSQAKVDGSVRATGLVQYSPFRDPEVRDFVKALPTEFLRPAGAPARDAGKAVLVEMVRRHELLPADVIAMPKQSPSDSPIDSWYAGQLRPDVLSLLDDLPFDVDRSAIDDVLRPKRAERLYRERASISHHAFQVIGVLASYAAFTGAVRPGSRPTLDE